MSAAERARDHLGHSRWWLVLAAAAMMAVVSPYQYVWTAIETPIAESLGVPLPAIGLVFTLFVVFQAGSQYPVGKFRDDHGPRGITALAGFLAGGGYVALASANEVWQVYLCYSLGAIGVGIVYTVAVNTALKWFPDRRGLTAGVGTMAFAAGSAAFVPFVRANAAPGAYADVLRPMGVLIGVVVVLGAFFLRDPPEGFETGGESGESHEREGRTYTPRETLRTWQFWLMYAAFVAGSGAGLLLTAKVVQFAAALGLSAGTATLSAVVLPLAGGVGRLVVGGVSDRFDRRYAIAGTFAVCGVGLVGALWAGLQGLSAAFVAAVFVATFFWSPLYALFPALVVDYYGTPYSSANNALLYSGKIWGGVFGGALAGWLVSATSWSTTFLLGAGLAFFAGAAALALREPR